MVRAALLLSTLALVGCEKSTAREIVVDLKTDYAPGRDFVGVVADYLVVDAERELSERTRMTLATPEQDYLTGERVGTFGDVPKGQVVVRVRLQDARGGTVAERSTRIDRVRSRYSLTVLITASCHDVICPAEGDPATRTECVSGRCVDPRCSPETPEPCDSLPCTTDDACSSRVECGVGVCVDRECFVRTDDASCGEGGACDVRLGCVGVETADGGVPARDASADAEPPIDAGDCEDVEVDCDDGLDGDCDGDVDCADADCDAARCDDGSACTTGDTCVAGACTGAGLDCDDGNPCTDDSCDASGCSYAPNTAACDDGVWCNGADRCRAGSCADHSTPRCPGSPCNERTRRCETCADDADCPSPPRPGPWSACGDFSDGCDESGSRTRTVTTLRCMRGDCVASDAEESEGCSRTTENDNCGETFFPPWEACTDFTSSCDETGTQHRTVTRRLCRGGACTDVPARRDRDCARDTDGDTCDDTETGGWGSCGSFATTCDETGTQTRSVTTHTCASGTCGSSTSMESRGCTRDTDGRSCVVRPGCPASCVAGLCVPTCAEPSCPC